MKNKNKYLIKQISKQVFCLDGLGFDSDEKLYRFRTTAAADVYARLVARYGRCCVAYKKYAANYNDLNGKGHIYIPDFVVMGKLLIEVANNLSKQFQFEIRQVKEKYPNVQIFFIVTDENKIIWDIEGKKKPFKDWLRAHGFQWANIKEVPIDDWLKAALDNDVSCLRNISVARRTRRCINAKRR